jgi:hypothetical protein
MGLLDIWSDWRKESGYGRDDLTTAGGGGGGGNEQTLQRTYKRGQFPPTDPKYIRDQKRITTPRGRVVKQEGSQLPSSNFQTRFSGGNKAEKAQALAASSAAKTPDNTVYQDAIMRGGKGANIPQDLNWWQKLSGMFNSKFDMDGAMANWEKKGGFEGLMANPAFTMGLAFMQAGAEGKTLGAGALDNVMKAGGISQHYKKIIEDRKQEPIQATAADIDEVKTLLDRVKLKEPNIWEKGLGWITGDNVTAKYDRAAEAVAIAYQEEIANMQRNYKGTKPFVIDDTVKEKALLKVLKDKRVKQKDGWAIFGPLTSGTIQKDTTLPQFKARGGPVQAGKPYVVGEEGPEVIIPRSDGNVLSNDDSQIYAMLLASNPQLQKVSRARAERILRTRFPEYFE